MNIEAILEIIHRLPEEKKTEAFLALLEYQDFLREREVCKEKDSVIEPKQAGK